MLGFDSYYTSIPLLIQLSFWGIKAIGTINAQRKGLGKVFGDLKKKLKKTRDPENKKKGGYDQGYYRWRAIDDDTHLKITVQKDSKVMLYGDNFLPSGEKVELTRFNKLSKDMKVMKFWVGHKLFNFLYGMVDQATSWRTKAGGHKTRVGKF